MIHFEKGSRWKPLLATDRRLPTSWSSWVPETRSSPNRMPWPSMSATVEMTTRWSGGMMAAILKRIFGG